MKYTTWKKETTQNCNWHKLQGTNLIILHAKSARQAELVGINQGEFLLYKKVYTNGIANADHMKAFKTLTEAKDFAESFADLYLP